jgi:hypothetical protein
MTHAYKMRDGLNTDKISNQLTDSSRIRMINADTRAIYPIIVFFLTVILDLGSLILIDSKRRESSFFDVINVMLNGFEVVCFIDWARIFFIFF